MTNENAIKWLKDYLKNGYFPMPQYEQALEMAIKALSQEPCDECRNKRTSFCGNCKEYDEFEPCDDAISRKLAIRAIKNLYPDIPRVDFNEAKRKWADKYAQYIECERLIEQLPSVTQKSGKWISHREHCENLGVMPSGLGAYEWCSNCDCGIDVREWHRNNYNYCPNCGARMESEYNE